MNKKVLTLCAGFLLAGSLATLDAKIAVVKTPEIGSSYVLGTGASEKAGTLNWVNDGLKVAANAEVTGFGTEWTLVQYVDADNKEIEGQFILQSPDGQYLASAGNNGQAKLVDDKDLAIVFNLKSKKYAEVVSDPQSQWTAGWYLTAAANGGLQGAAYSSGKPQSGYDRVQFVTFFTNKTFSADDLALVSSIDANEYYIVQARAVVLLLVCGFSRALGLIVDNGARAFFMLVHKRGELFKELRKIRLLDTFNQLFINNLIITFYEQKSTYALRGLPARECCRNGFCTVVC